MAPRAGEQRDNRHVVIGHGALHDGIGVGVQPLELLLVTAQHPPQAAGQVAHVQRTVAHGQHGLGTVIAGDDDKRAAITCVEHIVVSLLCITAPRLGMGQPQCRR